MPAASPARSRAARRPYSPRGAARALWSDQRPELLIAGPAGTGKTRSCLEKLHACALRWPGMRALVVRKTRESLTESGLVTFEEIVLPAGSPIARGPQRRMRQAYHYPNGSEVVLGGLDKSSRIMSTEFDMVIVLEATELAENDWEALTTRLRNGVMPFQQIVGDCNPGAPHHWLYQRVKAGRTAMLESRHEDNPRLWDADKGDWTGEGRVYIARLDALTGVRKDRLRYGKWVQAEGVVYEGWDRRIHLIDRFPIPAEWRRIRTIDFGYTNPFCCQWWAIDHDGRMYLYREIYHTRRTVRQHAEQIVMLSGDEWIEATVCDHDAEDRATLHENEILSVPATKAIKPGIQAVEERLKVAGDGKPRLVVFRDALVERDDSLIVAGKPWATEEEFDGYVWPKGVDGKPDKEVPLDLDNHGMDGMRYGVVYVDGRRPAAAPVAFGPAWGLSGMLNH